MGSEYVLTSPETVTMPGDVCRRLIGCGSGDAALCYLYILNAGGRFDRADAAEKTGRTPEQIDAAMAVLRRLGLIQDKGDAPAPPRPQELPQYTAEDIGRELSQGQAFRELVGETQNILGRILSSDDLLRLFGIYDYLGLPPEVILTLVSHCRQESARRYGPGRMVTMKFIEKVAFTWEREGLFSLDAAEAYLKGQTERRSALNGFAQAMGIRDRALSATEKKYIESWIAQGFSEECAAIAYDRTVVKSGRLSWSYMNSIFRSWAEKGLFTPAAIEAGDTFGKVPAPRRTGTGAVGGATAEEMARLDRAIASIKQSSEEGKR